MFVPSYSWIIILWIRAGLKKRIGKEIEIVVRKNENGLSAKESVPDLRDLIQFDIEEENF